jgi:hypothetical protein
MIRTLDVAMTSTWSATATSFYGSVSFRAGAVGIVITDVSTDACFPGEITVLINGRLGSIHEDLVRVVERAK